MIVTEQVIDGYKSISVTIDNTTIQLKILTSLLKRLPGLLSDGILSLDTNELLSLDEEKLKEALETYKSASDTLTSEILANSEVWREVEKAILFIKKI